MPLISVIAPAYNEELVLPEFVRRVRDILVETGEPFEILLVDDGSSDRTFDVLESLHIADSRVRVVRLSRNFGQEAALLAGLDYASGDGLILMDSDLQDPPELIPQFLDHWRQGARVVLGTRTARGENILRRMATRTFHWLFQKFSRFDNVGEVGLFSLIDRRVANQLRSMRERHRYLRGLRAYVGFRTAQVPYERQRREGQPTQSLAKLVQIAMDALLSFSSIPLRLSFFIGLMVSLFFVSYGLVLIILRLFAVNYERGFTTTAVAIMFLGGVQMIAIGIIGEYLGRIYEEVKRRPGYVVDEALGAVPFESTPLGENA